MQSNEHTIPIDPGSMSQIANAYILGLAASMNITPQEATAVIIETVARRRTNLVPVPSPYDKKEAVGA